MDLAKVGRLVIWIIIGAYLIWPADIIPMNPIDDVIVTTIGLIMNNQLKIKQ